MKPRCRFVSLLVCACVAPLGALAQTAPAAAAGSSAATADEPAVRLDVFEVSTHRDVGYRAGNAVSAMRMDVPVADIPQNISVYDRAWIEDIMAFDAADALAYEPTFINNYPPRSGGQFNIRGFDSSTFLLNGIAQANGFGSNITTVNIERLEVLKGPSAVLYGQGQIGGVINRITKRPQFKAASQYRLIGGFNEVNNKNIYRAEGDWTGPLNLPFLSDGQNSGKLAYRLNAMVENSGMYRVGSAVRESFISPSVRYDPSDRTSIVLEGAINRTSRTPLWEQPVSIINGRAVYGQIRPDGALAKFETGKYSPIPDSDDYARPSNDFALALDIRHAFTDRLQFRSQANYQDFSQDYKEYFPDQLNKFAVNIDPATNQPAIGYFDAAGVFQRNVVTPREGAVGLDYLLPRALRILRLANVGYSIRNEIVWKFDHRFATHNFLAGHSMTRGLSDLYRAQLNPNLASPQTLEPWQLVSVFYNNGGGPISRPRNGTVGVDFPALPSIIGNNLTRSRSDEYHLLDLVGLFENRLFLSGGFRHQRNQNDSYNRPLTGTPVRVQTNAKSDTWSYGVVYHVLKDRSLSLYANANQAFEPVTTISEDGYQLPPITGDQKEAGFKFELWQNRISGTFSYFKILRQNLPVSIATGIFRPNGEGVESKGWEFDVNAAITPHWHVFAGVASQDTFDNSRAPTYPIKVFNNVPERGYSLFTRYQFAQGPLKGVFLSGGGNYKGDRYTNWDTRPDLAWIVPAEWRFNASIGYTWRRGPGTYSAIVNVENLTNVDSINKSRYWDANPDTLRQVRFELRVRY
jgi:iron complex outermembrane receptor protein